MRVQKVKRIGQRREGGREGGSKGRGRVTLGVSGFGVEGGREGGREGGSTFKGRVVGEGKGGKEGDASQMEQVEEEGGRVGGRDDEGTGSGRASGEGGREGGRERAWARQCDWRGQEEQRGSWGLHTVAPSSIRP